MNNDFNINDEFVPIGSVLLLKGATKKVVVIGYAVVEDGSSKVWDYLGCAYPMGVISSDTNLLFDKDQIEEVVSLGYSDEEGEKFRKDLNINLRMMRN